MNEFKEQYLKSREVAKQKYLKYANYSNHETLVLPDCNSKALNKSTIIYIVFKFFRLKISDFYSRKNTEQRHICMALYYHHKTRLNLRSAAEEFNVVIETIRRAVDVYSDYDKTKIKPIIKQIEAFNKR